MISTLQQPLHSGFGQKTEPYEIIKDLDLSNKNIIITGGYSGIGLETTKALKKANAKVIVPAKRLDHAESILDGIVPQNDIYEMDLANLNSVMNFVELFSQLNLKLDILINNAGITGPTATLWEYDIEMWKKVVEINVMGTFNCCRSIVPNMIKNNYGRIVNVASVAGKDGNANASAYSVGKAGAIGLTKSLGKELADKNIAVNAVTPAGAKTRILDQMTKEHVQKMLSKVPRGRFLEVEEFTSLICWLSSEENTFSAAAVFDISGGRSTY